MVADLLPLARERQVLAIVADAIVAAAIGRALRVAIACSPSHLAFAGQLTRALHARGRACRCLASTSSNPPTDPPDGAVRTRDSSAVVEIVDRTHASNDGPVCQINIRVTEDSQTSRSGTSPTQDQDIGRHHDCGEGPDLVVDYSDPEGPTIRRSAGHLAISIGAPAGTVMKDRQ